MTYLIHISKEQADALSWKEGRDAFIKETNNLIVDFINNFNTFFEGKNLGNYNELTSLGRIQEAFDVANRNLSFSSIQTNTETNTESDDIFFYPEIWAKKQRFLQPSIYLSNINKPTTSTRIEKMKRYIEFLHNFSFLKFENSKELLDKIKTFEEKYNKCLNNYIDSYLIRTEKVLREQSLKLELDEETNWETIETGIQALQLKSKIKQKLKSNTHKDLTLYLEIVDILVTRNYFSPKNISTSERNWNYVKMSCMATAALCAFGSLLCAGLSLLFPGAAFPGFVLGKIALAGLIPGFMDLFHYFSNGCPISAKPYDIAFGVVIPIIMSTAVIATTIITSPILAPILLESVVFTADILMIFEYIGSFALNTFGSTLNTFYFVQTKKDTDKPVTLAYENSTKKPSSSSNFLSWFNCGVTKKNPLGEPGASKSPELR